MQNKKPFEIILHVGRVTQDYIIYIRPKVYTNHSKPDITVQFRFFNFEQLYHRFLSQQRQFSSVLF